LKVEVNIDPGCSEPRVVIHTDKMTPEIEALLRALSAPEKESVPVQTQRGIELLWPESILRAYAERGKVFVQAGAEVYSVKMRLYELEQRLSGWGFVRISASELVNVKKIESMDFSLAGTIRVTLKGGVTTYVSRRHVAQVKKLFDV
jgi:DNA-binding LytR/AlgR family response regulator